MTTRAYTLGGVTLGVVAGDDTTAFLSDPDAPAIAPSSSPNLDALISAAEAAGWDWHWRTDDQLLLHHCRLDEFLVIEADTNGRWPAEDALHLLEQLGAAPHAL